MKNTKARRPVFSVTAHVAILRPPPQQAMLAKAIAIPEKKPRHPAALGRTRSTCQLPPKDHHHGHEDIAHLAA